MKNSTYVPEIDKIIRGVIYLAMSAIFFIIVYINVREELNSVSGLLASNLGLIILIYFVSCLNCLNIPLFNKIKAKYAQLMRNGKMFGLSLMAMIPSTILISIAFMLYQSESDKLNFILATVESSVLFVFSFYVISRMKWFTGEKKK